MNEVKKCSLSGVAFTMDLDAFEALDHYLKSLQQTYGESSDGEEIVADIEARIAELILSMQNNDRIVEKPLILNIIQQMGTPEDITDSDLQSDTPRIPRRLYRDTENAKLGGVCAGIGRYFDINPMWVRLSMFIPIILTLMRWIPFMHWTGPTMGNLFGILVICYVIMWFVVPAARTARQKLEMNGERITANSIHKTTSATAQAVASDADSKAKPIIANVVSVFGQILLILMKMLAGIIVFGLILCACTLIVAISALLVGGHDLLMLPSPLQDTGLWFVVLALLTALLPSILLIYALMCLIASRKPGGKAIVGIFLLWLASIIGLVSVALHDGTIESFRKGRTSVERALQREVIVDGDTTTLERVLQEFDGETVIEEGRQSLRISVPSKQIDITVDKAKPRFSYSSDGKQVVIEGDSETGNASVSVKQTPSDTPQPKPEK